MFGNVCVYRSLTLHRYPHLALAGYVASGHGEPRVWGESTRGAWVEDSYWVRRALGYTGHWGGYSPWGADNLGVGMTLGCVEPWGEESIEAGIGIVTGERVLGWGARAHGREASVRGRDGKGAEAHAHRRTARGRTRTFFSPW